MNYGTTKAGGPVWAWAMMAPDCAWWHGFYALKHRFVHLTEQIAAGLFLIDVFCLGIKNSFFTILPPLKWQDFLERVSSHGPLENWPPTVSPN